MTDIKPFLYVKAGCPWCAEAEGYLKKQGIAYDKVDVRADAAELSKMKEISGQEKAPVMVWGDEILSDFGAAELEVFLREQGVVK